MGRLSWIPGGANRIPQESLKSRDVSSCRGPETKQQEHEKDLTCFHWS